MKKTVKVNIGGFVFYIDEDAFEILQNYLDDLNSRFANSDEGKEIIADIEIRIAEIFQERINDLKQVINISDVESMIEIMGKPEDYTEGETEEDENPKTKTSHRSHHTRRMYRDPDNRVVSGVCGGLANYFAIDPVIFRIIFVLLFFVIGPFNLLLYFILVISTPYAHTTAQKLEMKGERVNVSTIEKTIREEFEHVKENFDQFRSSKKTKEFIKQSGNSTVHGLNFFFRIFAIVFGIIFIITGLGFLLAMLTSVAFNFNFFSWGWHNAHAWPFFSDIFSNSTTFILAIISLGLIIGIPILGLIYTGLRMVINFKANNKIIILSALSAWFIAVIIFAVLSVSEISNFRTRTNFTQIEILDEQIFDTLYLQTVNNEDFSSEYSNIEEEDFNDNHVFFDDNEFRIGNFGLIEVGGEQKYYGIPRLDVEKSRSGKVEIELNYRARGNNRREARLNAENIDYQFEQKDSLILFDQIFTIENNKKWRKQELWITVKIPENTVIFLDKSMRNIIYDIDNVHNTWDGNMIDDYWIMTKRGLTNLEKYNRNERIVIKTDKIINLNEENNTNVMDTTVVEIISEE